MLARDCLIWLASGYAYEIPIRLVMLVGRPVLNVCGPIHMAEFLGDMRKKRASGVHTLIFLCFATGYVMWLTVSSSCF